MHIDFYIPIEKDLLAITADWGQVAYIYYFEEIGAVRVGDSNDVFKRMMNHKGNLPGPVQLLRVVPGGKQQADKWEEMLSDFYVENSGGSWYGYTAGCRSYIRRIHQPGVEKILDRLIEIENERHFYTMEWMNAARATAQEKANDDS